MIYVLVALLAALAGYGYGIWVGYTAGRHKGQARAEQAFADYLVL